MKTTKLKARAREVLGSAESRRLRRAGELPANLTGLGESPVSLVVPEHEFVLLHHQGARLVELDLDDGAVEALIREIQFDTFGDRILHVDFDRIERGHKIEVEVAFDFFGEPAGAEEGGVFQVIMDVVNVECLPSQIPDRIEVDVRELEIGDEVRIRDVKFPEDVAPVEIEEDELVAMVSEPEVEEEEEAEDLLGEGTSEPEVMGRKAAEDEEEED